MNLDDYATGLSIIMYNCLLMDTSLIDLMKMVLTTH